MKSTEEESRWGKWWKRVPTPVRQALVLSLGITLIVTGLLLIVLPGPFTIPLVIAGLVVMASEFAWAAAMTEKAKHHGAKMWDIVKGLWRRRQEIQEAPQGLSSPSEGRAMDNAPSVGESLIEHDGNNEQEQESSNAPRSAQDKGEEEGGSVEDDARNS